MRLGYCCINLTLRAQKPSVYTGRTLIKRLFSMQKASACALQNTTDLLAILQWNVGHDIRVFRITSDLFPRMTDPDNGYRIGELENAKAIRAGLRSIGKYAAENKIQLSFHPGPFVLFGSPREQVNGAGLKEVEAHAQIAEYICEGADLDIPINIHVGGSYQGDFKGTARRWLKNFARLPGMARKRLVLENDDRPGGWSIRRLYNYIYEHSGVPLTIDLHHFVFCHDRYSMEEDYWLAKTTWQKRSNQVHYSESAGRKLTPAHSDYLKHPLPAYVLQDRAAHVLLEAKAKELALLEYRHAFKLRETGL